MRIAAIVCLITAAVFSVRVGFAHPPAEITLTWDAEAKTVTAVIVHPVQNPGTHNIYKVDVALNGKEILEHAISRQDDGQKQLVVYRIPDAKAGDVISVEGYCNINGKLERELKVQ